MSTRPTFAVEFLADTVNNIDPISGGQYGHQIKVCLNMSRDQRRVAVMTILGAMPESEARDWLRSEVPEWFAQVPAGEATESDFGAFLREAQR
jgi:hypothetical protein